MHANFQKYAKRIEHAKKTPVQLLDWSLLRQAHESAVCPGHSMESASSSVAASLVKGGPSSSDTHKDKAREVPQAGVQKDLESPFQIRRPKPPPPPQETPAMARMLKLATALERLCETFEELADDQAKEEKLRQRMDVIISRVAAIEVEMVSIQRSERLKQAASTLEQSEEVDELRRRLRELQQERQKLEQEHDAAPPGIANGTRVKAGAQLNDNDVDYWSIEAVQYLNIMGNSHSRAVRMRMANAVARLAEKSDVTKQQICSVPCMKPHPMSSEGAATIVERIVSLMKTGGLDAIDTIAVLTEKNLLGCDLVREAGAVVLLASFINSENDEKNVDVSRQLGTPAAGGVGGLADLADRPTIVPVTIKARAVAALRNIATSSAQNLENITSQRVVIPQLVQLMTKMDDKADNASSKGSSSGGSSGDGEEGQAGRKAREKKEKRREKRAAKLNKALKEKMEAEMLDRKQLARDNRKLAESAGQMLHTLIIEGSEAVKKIIISAIIAQVQQPGSVPPEDVPALMTILRSTAEEQLTLVQKAEDYSALQAALQFGRWIKLPTLMLGEARINFKKTQDAKKKEQLHNLRKLQLGHTIQNPNDLPPPEEWPEGTGPGMRRPLQAATRAALFVSSSDKDGAGKGGTEPDARGAAGGGPTDRSTISTTPDASLGALTPQQSQRSSRTRPVSAPPTAGRAPPTGPLGSHSSQRSTKRLALKQAAAEKLREAAIEKKRDEQTRRELEEGQRKQRREREKAHEAFVRASQNHRQKVVEGSKAKMLDRFKSERGGGTLPPDVVAEYMAVVEGHEMAVAVSTIRMFDKFLPPRPPGSSPIVGAHLPTLGAHLPTLGSDPIEVIAQSSHGGHGGGRVAQSNYARVDPRALETTDAEAAGASSAEQYLLPNAVGLRAAANAARLGPHTRSWLEMMYPRPAHPSGSSAVVASPSGPHAQAATHTESPTRAPSGGQPQGSVSTGWAAVRATVSSSPTKGWWP